MLQLQDGGEAEIRLPGRFKVSPQIAGAAVYLASKAGSFMTGQSLVIDGGVTI